MVAMLALASPSRRSLLLIAGLASRASAWEAVAGLKTMKTTVTAAPDGSPTVVKGDTVTVHATGTVKQNEKKFWSTKDPGQQPFTYQAGAAAAREGPQRVAAAGRVAAGVAAAGRVAAAP